MKLKKQVFSCDIKGIDAEARTLTAVASTETVDRDGDIIRAAGWDLANFLKNPVIPWAHDYRQPPVAKATRVWVENDRLMFEAKFATVDENPFADQVFKLYQGGFMNAFSVGFRALERKAMYDENERYTGSEYVRQELWEISCVPVPANPEALSRAVEKGIISEDEEGLFQPPADEPPADDDSEPKGGKPTTKAAQPDEASDDLVGRVASIEQKLEEIGGGLTALADTMKQLLQPKKDPAETADDDPQPEPDAEASINPEEFTRALSAAVAKRAAAMIAQAVEKRIAYLRGKVD